MKKNHAKTGADAEKSFIDDKLIEEKLKKASGDDRFKIRDIIAKALSVKALSLDETAALLNTSDPDLLAQMEEAALEIKKKVYDNRIVTFAPLYVANICVNNCLYCGFRCSNAAAERTVLAQDEIRREVEVLAGSIGHKRVIVVCGEHPDTGVEFLEKTLDTVYGTKVPVKNNHARIRRANVNAAPMPVEELKRIKNAGIGTYQVFQETYHHETYRAVHPENTLKGDYNWRLYCMHRAMEAGIDDVGIGVLFGLYNWKFEVMGLAAHAMELESVFGVGPHTISFPRIEPAENTPFASEAGHTVSDADFLKLIAVIRLAVPYTGMIITAREPRTIRSASLKLGITQTDASSKIGIGGYSRSSEDQQGSRQQFYLGDTRSLDEIIREFSESGLITSFCTAGYRCSRTGKCIMDLLKSGAEGRFCKLNAVLTFREWLDDFASPETKNAGEKVIQKEIDEIRRAMPKTYGRLIEYYNRISSGERDIFF